MGMDESAIRAALDACLVGNPETPRMMPDTWAQMPDPFPAWGAPARESQEVDA